MGARKMRVIFLDFDGVLNSAASFYYENRRRKKDKRITIATRHTLDHVCCSNFQYILDQCPDVKIVISSTWRVVHKLGWLRKRLKTYGVDGSKVIGKTPQSFSGWRSREISEWLEDHPEVTEYIVIDDNSLGGTVHDHRFVKTKWDTGLTLQRVYDAMKLFGVELNYRTGIDDE